MVNAHIRHAPHFQYAMLAFCFKLDRHFLEMCVSLWDLRLRLKIEPVFIALYSNLFLHSSEQQNALNH